MKTLNLSEDPHRRFNPLTGEWILISPHRTRRPWQGHVEHAAQEEHPQYDPSCYLCPGNSRAGSAVNPHYEGAFAFDNDFSALLQTTPAERIDEEGLLVANGEPGLCRVVCFSPRHDLTLAELDVAAISGVIDMWVEEYESLGGRREINYVQIFENKGELMGCSNPHPHCQIWAQHSIPDEPAKESRQQSGYLRAHERCMLCDYIMLEEKRTARIVIQNEAFIVLVPFWAVWPFETLIVSRRHRSHIGELDETERDGLADILKRITTRYDNIFKISFPYSAGIHQAPTDGDPHPEWHLHMHFYPPLLRSSTVRKFMVGYEMMGEPQRDLTAESAAETLRQLPERHYRIKTTSEPA